MGKAGNPRHGSMQFWPRKRAKRAYPRVNAYKSNKDDTLLGFAGYKAGMTHLQYIDNRKTSPTKGQLISTPVTVVECPPLKVASIRFHQQENKNLLVATEIWATKLDKELDRKITSLKKQEKTLDSIKLEDYSDITLNVYTQPKLTNIGKKKPEIFEVPLAGTMEEKLTYAKEHLGKEIKISELFKEGQFLDVHAVTKGKGFQGPVKRFGVKIRSHKSEKTKRGPGSLGGWVGQAHTMYRIAHAGQMGYHTRTEYNKWLLKVDSKPEEINPKGGFVRYGLVKNDYILIKGGVAGARKRLIRFNRSIRLHKRKQNLDGQAPTIEYISLESKQGK